MILERIFENWHSKVERSNFKKLTLFVLCYITNKDGKQ